MKNQLRKIFAIASTNIDNKADIDKIDVKLEENEVFYTSKNKNYSLDNIIVLEDSSVEINKILKIEITIKK